MCGNHPPSPYSMGRPSRWHTVMECNFKFREAIHMVGRATLMGLHRAVAGTAGHGHRFNFSSLLAFASIAVQLFCVLAWMYRGFFDTRRPGVIPRTKGLDGPWFWSCVVFAELCPAACASACFWSSWCSGQCQPRTCRSREARSVSFSPRWRCP